MIAGFGRAVPIDFCCQRAETVRSGPAAAVALLHKCKIFSAPNQTKSRSTKRAKNQTASNRDPKVAQRLVGRNECGITTSILSRRLDACDYDVGLPGGLGQAMLLCASSRTFAAGQRGAEAVQVLEKKAQNAYPERAISAQMRPPAKKALRVGEGRGGHPQTKSDFACLFGVSLSRLASAASLLAPPSSRPRTAQCRGVQFLQGKSRR